MPNFTEKYNLKKPLGTENYNVADQNSNMDIIDEELGKQAKQINVCLSEVGDKQGLLTTVKTSIVGAINSLCTLASNKVNGLMSKEDKAKLDGIQVGATNYVHPKTHPFSMITGAPTSYPANGGNADTLGGMTLAQIKELIAKGGDIMGKTFKFEEILINAQGTKTWIETKNFINEKGGIVKMALTNGSPAGNCDAYTYSKFRITVDGNVVFSGNVDLLMISTRTHDSSSANATGGFFDVPFKKSFKIEVYDEYAAREGYCTRLLYYLL